MSSRLSGQFVVATPGRSVCDDNARALELLHRLRFLALATRRGVAGVSREHTRLNPGLGLLNYLAARSSSTFRGESFRFARHPAFDRWVKAKLTPGDHIISSYGYTNECFRWIREHGGKTFLDGGNTHPANFWEIVAEEHRIWQCDLPPVAEHHYERSLQMMEMVDYVLCPSDFVRQSFLARGFRPEQILPNVYPVNLANFAPTSAPRPAGRPFTLVNTGILSLRKGTPYLLEAFRLIRRKVPDARLLLTNVIADSVDPIMQQFADLPIDWAPPLPHLELAARLREADLFVLPSLEEGLARTGLEALACGVRVIVTPNTGISEFVQPGVSGTVVPIRDPEAIAAAALEWWEKIQGDHTPARAYLDEAVFGFPNFARVFFGHLQKLSLVEKAEEPAHMSPAGRGKSPSKIGQAERATGMVLVATPARSPHDIYARALGKAGALRAHCHGARQFSAGVPASHSYRNPLFGAMGYFTGALFSTYTGESLRFALHPAFDAWAKQFLQPGDSVLSSYGYLNDCFRKARENGGHALLDAGNSHPEQFWQIVAEEHALRQCKLPPVAPHHHQRALESATLADYVFAVSTYVRDSFVARGFPTERILVIPRPINIQFFHPSPRPRSKDRPPTFICTGALNFRKGGVYLLEAFDQLHRRLPDARFLLTDAVADSLKPWVAQFRHLPIDWAPMIPPGQLAERLRSADVFMLLSLEEGMARTGVEALACGLPVVVTKNTGVNDLVIPGVNGEVVPLRDPGAAAEAAFGLWERIRQGERFLPTVLQERLSVATFESSLLTFLKNQKIITDA